MVKRFSSLVVLCVLVLVSLGAGKPLAMVDVFVGTAAQLPNGTGILLRGTFPEGQVLESSFFTNIHMPPNGVVQFQNAALGQFVTLQDIPLLNISGTILLKSATATTQHAGIIRIYRKADNSQVWVHRMYEEIGGNIGEFSFTVPFFALGNATDFYFTISVAQDWGAGVNPALVMITFSP